MADEQLPHHFDDAAQVKAIMKQMEEGYRGNQSLPTMNALTIFSAAIAKLADEIEQLKAKHQ